MTSISPPFGFFETLLVVRGRAVMAAEHVERLVSSARGLALPYPKPDEVRSAIDRISSECSAQDEAAVRCAWLTSSPDPDDAGAWTLMTDARAIPDEVISRRANGRVTILDPSFVRQMPALKTVGDAARVLARRAAAHANADEALYTHRDGNILEGASTNIFAESGTVLRTPSVPEGILPGTLRAWVIENAPAAGYRVEEGPVTDEDLAAGSFLTSSLTPLAPVRQIDGRPVNSPGKRFAELLEAFRATLPQE